MNTETTATYAESMGEERFDWNAFLDNAEAGYTSLEDNILAEALAASWVTCACGNQCNAIDRNPISGSPIDLDLRSLGKRFSDNVDAGNWRRAKKTLARIERRSIEILSDHTPPSL